MKTKALIAAMVLAGIASVASADVQVRFIKPAEFSDVKDTHWQLKEETLKDLEAHLRSAASKQLPGKDLLIEVTDVDLAGMVEPVGRHMTMIRVVREIGRPAIDLRYVLSEKGQEVRRGEARLSDLAFMNRFSRYSDGDPLRYEKRMIDDWLAKEFGTRQVASQK